MYSLVSSYLHNRHRQPFVQRVLIFPVERTEVQPAVLENYISRHALSGGWLVGSFWKFIKATTRYYFDAL